MAYWKHVFLALILGVNLPVFAKEFTCTRYPNLPITLQGICEGEGSCGYLAYDKAILPVFIYEKPSQNSKIVDRLEPCELIRDTEPYLVVKKLGKVEVINSGKALSSLGVKKGDVLPLLNYVDDGDLDVCVGDKIEQTNSLYETLPSGSVKVLEPNKTKAWVRLKTPRDVVGYALDISEEESEYWYMDIYMYEPTKICPGDTPESPVP